MNFERVVIIRNPVSTHAERGEKYIADLREIFPNAEVIVLKTVRGGLKANEVRLRERAGLFGPKTLLGVIAGDGTFNMIATILMQFGGEAVQTTLVPLWGGNANDLAHVLSGRAPRSLAPVLARAKRIAVRPIECTLTMPDGSNETRLAVCYASFGASASAARRLGEKIRSNHPSHVVPGVRFMREAGSIGLAIKETEPFTVQKGGTQAAVFEWTFLNGSRMAKVGGLPYRLSDDYMYSVLVSRKHAAFITMFEHFVRLKNRRNVPKFRRTIETFVMEDNVDAQFDGEAIEVPAGTKVAVTLAETPLKLLAAKAALQMSENR